ncbi:MULTISPECIES: DUF6086 family protein [Nocardia]|uniref:DUF6086 family protein n=1 Tax=Nocardia TaxID=1817 RepID=UPI001893E1B6|nr:MULTISPECIES: DUF6086 family protein [Nocardia]MBF6349748.1 hypothetical protein [Nocardia flavorosea]
MSYIFDVNDETVWSPALRAGRLYTLMAEDIADVLGTETGMTAIASDFWDINIDKFEIFVHAMYETYFSSSHPVLKGLVGSVLAPSIVVLERGGRVISPASTEEQEFIVRAHDLSMAR